MLICPNCGARNIDSAKFCVNCGAELPDASKEKSTVPPSTSDTPAVSRSGASLVTVTQSPAPRSPGYSKTPFFTHLAFWGSLMIIAGFFFKLDQFRRWKYYWAEHTFSGQWCCKRKRSCEPGHGYVNSCIGHTSFGSHLFFLCYRGQVGKRRFCFFQNHTIARVNCPGCICTHTNQAVR